MIYTVTLNPSIDCIVNVDNLIYGSTNRAVSQSFHFGGKGINVSAVLSQLEIKSVALGFIAGFTGDAIKNEISDKNITPDFIKLKNGCSRINIKISSSKETEINAPGQAPDTEELKTLMQKISLINDGDTLVLAGSVPKMMDDNIYAEILRTVSDKNIRTIVDASKMLLTNTLKYKPFLVKPNKQELSEIFNVEINDNSEIKKYASELRNMGAKNVLVSLGKDGAMLVDEYGNIHTQGIVEGKTKFTVGAGDSMVAGFLAGYEKTADYKYALDLASACGIATAFSDTLAKKENINSILNKLQKR